MALTKYKLGSIIIPHTEKCGISNLTPYQISGVNREKEFFEPSHQVGEDTSKYQVVPPFFFACNLMHVGRDKVLPIAYNHSGKIKYVSPAYTVFSIRKGSNILSEYFYILLKSNERDRYFWFHADSSVRDGMSWNDFCDIEIEFPDLAVQQKYVDIYNAMVANQQSYERGLEDLKLVCDGYIENLRRQMPCEKIGKYITECNEKNDRCLTLEHVRGIATSKDFIDTKANMDGVSLSNYKIVNAGEIAFISDTSRRGEKISLALNSSQDTFLVSAISTIFKTDQRYILPEYLMLFFKRDEFDRYARFNSWGSARENFSFDEMQNVEIPIPDISIQQSIVDIYHVYMTRKSINEKLKAQIKSICPILIKGSLEEGREIK